MEGIPQHLGDSESQTKEEEKTGNEQLPKMPMSCVLRVQGGPPRLSGLGLTGEKTHTPRFLQLGGPGEPRTPEQCDNTDPFQYILGFCFPSRKKETSHSSVGVSPSRVVTEQTSLETLCANTADVARTQRADSKPSQRRAVLRWVRQHVSDGETQCLEQRCVCLSVGE